jgi:uncharacterized protein YqhQ
MFGYIGFLKGAGMIVCLKILKVLGIVFGVIVLVVLLIFVGLLVVCCTVFKTAYNLDEDED